MERPATEGYSLSPQQERSWRASRGGFPLWGVRAIVDVRGPLDRARLERALRVIAGRHEILRTTLVQPAGLETALQVIASDHPAATLAIVTNGVHAPADWRGHLQALDLAPESASGLKVALVCLDPLHHTLLLALSNTHADAATAANLVDELAAAYATLASSGDGASVGLPDPPQFADAAEWQISCLESEEFAGERAYWTNVAARQTPPALPFIRAAALRTVFAADHVERLIEPTLAADLQALATRRESGLAELFEAGWLALLWRCGGSASSLVLHDGRRHDQIRPVLGPLSKFLPRQVELTASMTTADLLGELRRLGRESRLREEYFDGIEAAVAAPAFEFLDCSRQQAIDGIDIRIRHVEAITEPFLVKLSITFDGEAITAHVWYDTAACMEADAARLADAYVTLLRSTLDADRPIAALCMTPVDQQAIELEWSRGARLQPAAARTVFAAFQQQVAEHPDAEALVSADRTLTYAALDAAARRIARQVQATGTGASAERLVAVMTRETSNGVAAFLGALRAGASYVPIDPSAPDERIAAILQDANVAAIVTDDVARARTIAGDRLVVDIGSEDESGASNADPAAEPSGDALAYVMYTSGSTGAPKGVMVTQGGLAQSTRARQEVYGRWTRCVLLSPYIFDSSVASIYGALCSGGALLLPSEETRRDPAAVLDFMRRHRATHVLMVPSLYAALLAQPRLAERVPETLGVVIVAGEACPADLVQRHRELLAHVALFNEYGPTEGTVWATVARLDDGEASEGPVSIGRAIPEAQVVLLDRAFDPALPGTIGELFIGGAGVARGYLGQPGQTAAAFVPSPFEPGARLYRTGDLARRAADGALLFVGRHDEQIKLHGHRIEPAEIEAALRRLPGVEAAAVVPVATAAGAPVLVGCVESREALAPRFLQEGLRRLLPAHLIPAGFVTLAALPRTATGKIDRQACAAHAREALQRSDSRAPRTPLEMRLSDIWRELLGLDAIGVEDDFFALGGHSLLAIRLLARVRELTGVEIKLHELFDAPTIAGVATRVEERRNGPSAAFDLTTVTPDEAGRYEPFPLNRIQEAYWVGRKEGFELGNVGSTNYFEFDIPHLDIDRFTRALRALIARHDMLRATIHPDGFQQVAPEAPPYVIETVDLSQAAPEDAERRLRETRDRMSAQSLRTDVWPLFDIVAHHLGAATRLHISTELVVCDAVSSRILLRDLYHLYHDAESPLAPLELRFRDYVMAEQALRAGERFARARGFWQDKLQSLPPAPELPLAKDPRQIAAPRFSTLKHELSDATWSQLKRRAAAAGVTPTAVLCASYATALSMWAKSPRFTLNLTTYARLPFHPQVHDIVGDFTSLTMIDVDCGAETFAARARRLQQEIWQNLDHAEFGGVDVMRELRRLHGNGSRALMPVVFTSQLGTTTRDDPTARRWMGELVFSSGQAPQVWIDHQVAEPEGKLQFWWDYLDELFPPALVEAIFAGHCALLESLARDEEPWSMPAGESFRRAAPEVAGGALTRIAAEDVDLSLFPGGVLHAGFLRQAAMRPEAVAVTWEAAPGVMAALTYDGLRAWAWRVAEWVRETADAAAPASPETKTEAVVALLLPKGWMQAAAALGVQWAGAAYVPLDVSWPAARVRDVLAQTGCRRVIGTPDAYAAIGEMDGVAWVYPESWAEGVAPESAADAWRRAAADATATPGPATETDLAYVIYTSGSTGRPKGVMIEHGAACLTLAAVIARWSIGPADRVLALSSLSFDLSVFDLFGIWAAGGAVVMPSEPQRRDAGAWLRLADAAGVTMWNSVPALLQMAVEQLESRHAMWPGPLRLVWMSGDWIPLPLPDRLRARAPQAAVVSLGGATEAAIWSIVYEIDQADPAARAEWRSVPYGTALAGQSMHVLRPAPESPADADAVAGAPVALTPCPPWVTGRLYIGGGGLARGYWSNAEETARRFVTDALTGARLYDTGDLGRVWPDGTIELLGRADTQVKIQGYRVELGEIEATLVKHPQVAAAAVTAFDTPGGSRQLAAYIVPREAGAPSEASPAPVAAVSAAGGTSPATPVRPGLQRWVEALEFKLARPGLRRPPADAPSTALTRAADAADADSQAALDLFQRRRSARTFDNTTRLDAGQLGRWLECLREQSVGESYRRLYPSAGSMYPVQAYLFVKPGQIDDLSGGLYYYDPLEHRLVLIAQDVPLTRELYDPVNRTVFDRSSFALFLIGKLSAIAPLYADAARDFCLIEAGCMTQLLTTHAPSQRVALCPIGGLAFDRVQASFGIDGEHVLLHSLLGGAPAPVREESTESRASAPASSRASSAATPAARADALIEEVKGFVREMLPEYLVPARFIVLERLPLSSNGKVDRAQLPAPAPRPERTEAVPPRTETERTVGAMWMALLGLSAINVSDDFFALGGDSIVSVRFLNRVRDRFLVELPLRGFLGASTLEEVARQIEDAVIAQVDRLDDADVQGLLG